MLSLKVCVKPVKELLADAVATNVFVHKKSFKYLIALRKRAVGRRSHKAHAVEG